MHPCGSAYVPSGNMMCDVRPESVADELLSILLSTALMKEELH